MKERKAVTTQQCRILVKGAPHLPLQLSCGSSIQFLYPTWQYLKLLEAQGILPDVPKERYREVEDWMLDHVREFNEWRVKGDTSAMTRRGPISLVRKSNESPDTGSTAAATAIGGGSLDPHNTLLVLTPRGETSTDNLTSGNASLAANADPKGTVKDRLKSLWHGFRNSPNARPTTPASDEAPTTLTATTPDRNESDARLTSPAAPTQASSSSATQSFSTVPEQQQAKVSKRDAVKEFLKRKLGRTTERPPEEEDDDSSDDEDFAKQSTDAPPSLVACESLDDFRLNWKHLRRIYYEAQKKDAEGHRGHETFDRIFRRRRAVNKWQYQNREAIQEQIKANRTVAIMTVIGIYTLIMHLVPFDVFCMLLLVMEIGLHYLCTNYREIAIALGRRAARTRVDRVKDWFYFGVTRRKTRNDVDPPGGLPLED